jgi:hypothetical protein
MNCLETTFSQFTCMDILKVNNNQHVYLFQNQIMKCIIYHNVQLWVKSWPFTPNAKKVSLHTINVMA